MSSEITERAVLDALGAVRDSSIDRDIVAAKFVKDIKIDRGRVTFVVDSAEIIRGIFHHEMAIERHLSEVRACLQSMV